MTIAKEQILKVKQENPGAEVYQLSAGPHAILVRSPSDAIWAAFQDAKEKGGTRALKQLVLDCVLHPSADEVRSIFEKKPALANTWGVKLMDIAGLEEEAQVKKV